MKKKLTTYISAFLLVALIAFFGFDFPGGQELPALPHHIGTEDIENTVPATTAVAPEYTMEESEPQDTDSASAQQLPDMDGSYTEKEDVALYIHVYGTLPQNFITKNEARSLGWEGGSLEDYAPGMCIGGDRFGNYEELLPDAPGRSWTECDIDTLGSSSRGAKRIVFSNDGLIYYTDDHYESFTLLYGEE